MSLDVNYIRDKFPSLQVEANGYKPGFFDGPGGTQAPQSVMEAMNDYLIKANANKHGPFETSKRTDEIIFDARKAMADFLGCNWNEIAFAENTTTNIYKLAAALRRQLSKGDEILITEMDHEANRGPWLALEETGINVKEVKFDTETCTLDLEDYKSKLSDKTKVVAFVYASNATGTINPVNEMITMAKEVNAITVVDAVHYALHGPIDVKEIDVDFLLCSVYKFFGPHLGVIYGKKNVFEELNPLRLRPQGDKVPEKFETGTKNHEGIAGTIATIDFIADLGDKFGEPVSERYKDASERRKNIISAMNAIDDYERPLTKKIIDGISMIDGINIYRPPSDTPCTSTISFDIEGKNSNDVAEKLNDKGLFVWAGDFYATRLVERLGLHHKGGLVRIGLAPYNTEKEVKRLTKEIQSINK